MLQAYEELQIHHTRSLSFLASLVVALFMFVGLGTAFSGDMDKADAAFQRQEYKTAFRLILPLAERGNTVAQYKLGILYAYGQGVTQNYSEAARWFRKSADQGNADGQYNLGFMYANGQGVTQDYVEAHKWWNISAAQGNKKAFKDRDIVAGRMTTAQITMAQRLAREWRPKVRTLTK